MRPKNQEPNRIRTPSDGATVEDAVTALATGRLLCCSPRRPPRAAVDLTRSPRQRQAEQVATSSRPRLYQDSCRATTDEVEAAKGAAGSCMVRVAGMRRCPFRRRLRPGPKEARIRVELGFNYLNLKTTPPKRWPSSKSQRTGTVGSAPQLPSSGANGGRRRRGGRGHIAQGSSRRQDVSTAYTLLCSCFGSRVGHKRLRRSSKRRRVQESPCGRRFRPPPKSAVKVNDSRKAGSG